MSNQDWNVYIANSDGTLEISSLTFAGLEPGTATDPLDIRIYNAEPTTIDANYLIASRIDMIFEQRTGETDADAQGNGLEIIENTWVEARLLESDPWTPIGHPDDGALDLGSITGGEYVECQIRVNVPSDAETFGPVAFCLCILSRVTP